MATPSTEIVEDFFGFLQLYSDGSVVRSAEPPLTSYDLIKHKDVVVDEQKGLWARIYLPPQSVPGQRFPVIIYFHGGGFCFYSPASPALHQFCLKWASEVGAVIVSVNYRLAPEHRLPAAYDDSIVALEWLQSKSSEQDPLESHGDYSNVFLAGDSAGGNVADYVGMKGAETLPIKGMILLYPFFGGEERTASEASGGADRVLTLDMSDRLWRLALPEGSNRDHPYSNPLSAPLRSHGGGSGSLKILFVIAGLDILSDRQSEYCEVLKKKGEHAIEKEVFDEEDHGFAVIKLEDTSSAKLIQSVSDFIK